MIQSYLDRGGTNEIHSYIEEQASYRDTLEAKVKEKEYFCENTVSEGHPRYINKAERNLQKCTTLPRRLHIISIVIFQCKTTVQLYFRQIYILGTRELEKEGEVEERMFIVNFFRYPCPVIPVTRVANDVAQELIASS